MGPGKAFSTGSGKKNGPGVNQARNVPKEEDENMRPFGPLLSLPGIARAVPGHLYN
jgi:hypothetical protein